MVKQSSWAGRLTKRKALLMGENDFNNSVGPICLRLYGDPLREKRLVTLDIKKQLIEKGFATHTITEVEKGKYDGEWEEFGTECAIETPESVVSVFKGVGVQVSMSFVFDRPKSHYRTGKFNGELKESAPQEHIVKPDIDNLEKFYCDALNHCGVWTYDSCVVRMLSGKRYVGVGEKAHVDIIVEKSWPTTTWRC